MMPFLLGPHPETFPQKSLYCRFCLTFANLFYLFLLFSLQFTSFFPSISLIFFQCPAPKGISFCICIIGQLCILYQFVCKPSVASYTKYSQYVGRKRVRTTHIIREENCSSKNYMLEKINKCLQSQSVKCFALFALLGVVQCWTTWCVMIPLWTALRTRREQTHCVFTTMWGRIQTLIIVDDGKPLIFHSKLLSSEI